MRISDWSSDVCSSDLHPFARSTAPCKSTLPPTLRRWPLGTSSTLQLARRLCRLPPLHHLAGQGQTSGDRRRPSRQETRNFVGKDRKSTRLKSSHYCAPRMKSSA